MGIEKEIYVEHPVIHALSEDFAIIEKMGALGRSLIYAQEMKFLLYKAREVE